MKMTVFTIVCCVLLVVQLIGPSFAQTDKLFNAEAQKYSSLPHTVFSPQGRLYNVERNALSSSDSNDISSSLILAFNFDDDKILLLSTKSFSPYFRRKVGEKIEPDINNDSYVRSESMPFMVLPSDTVAATGGTAADALALRCSIREIALSLCKANDGMRSTHRIEGSLSTSMLAKKIADYQQLPTQNAASNRMLSSAAIVAGIDVEENRPKLSIWRCDPTGQFWKCGPMAAVGRGAGNAEMKFLREVKKWRDHGRIGKESLNELNFKISSSDVERYMASLSFDETIILACRCLVEALDVSKNEDSFNVRAILLRKDRQSTESCIETVCDEILLQGLKMVS